jgi:hypothetical protein
MAQGTTPNSKQPLRAPEYLDRIRVLRIPRFAAQLQPLAPGADEFLCVGAMVCDPSHFQAVGKETIPVGDRLIS